ncbi:MAG TPA: DUF3048 domain-containing protein [Anaerolineales bacterium]
MKKLLYLFASLSLLLAACGSATPLTNPTSTETPVPSATLQQPTMTPLPSATVTPSPTPSPTPPITDFGPSNFPAGVNPLTGLTVADPTQLLRRPLLIKVSNLPRSVRPQWGLSLADIVFEYYTEEGSTRFAALFYGNNADIVAPIRSGRFIDVDLVRGYKAVFAFGSAYVAEMDRFVRSEFANRLVVEGPNSPLKRYDPNGLNDLVVNTADLSAFITAQGVENGRQNLDGMTFKVVPPAGGQPGTQTYLRYSGSIYNRWDYDPVSGKYLRFADKADDMDRTNPQYAQSTDRLTGQLLAFDNVVVLFVTHETYAPNIYDILFSGSGGGFAFRDDLAYQVKWQRNDTDVVSLFNPDGTPFPFKPGTTWFELMGASSGITQTAQGYQFLHLMP